MPLKLCIKKKIRSVNKCEWKCVRKEKLNKYENVFRYVEKSSVSPPVRNKKVIKKKEQTKSGHVCENETETTKKKKIERS